MRTFKLKATIEITDPNFGDRVDTPKAIKTTEEDLKAWAADSDMELVVTDIQPIEDKNFIA